MNDTFSLLQKYTGISKYSKSEVITPQWVVTDMVDLLPPEVFTPETRFLDPAVKSGRFLIEIYHRLMNSEQMRQTFPNEQDRHKHIIEKQLFGFATSPTAATVVRKTLYDDPLSTGNIRFTSGKATKELVQGAFNIMKFDIVIGNPPYNDDIYLDFVTLGHQLSAQYTIMITPAKWQAKGGDKNEKFRKDIVPYMSKIVFYPNAGDVFNIRNLDGISYFLISKIICRDKHIKDVDNHPAHSLFNQDWHFDKLDFTLHSSIVNNILSKCSASSKLKPKYNSKHKYLVHVSLMLSSGGGKTSFSNFSADGKLLVLNPMTIEEIVATGNYKNLYSSDSKSECESYISYMNTKLMRFILYISCCGNSVTAVETWRFVPNPGAFDHIFTDAELYKKYGLTPEEINIIESVIKERK